MNLIYESIWLTDTHPDTTVRSPGLQIHISKFEFEFAGGHCRAGMDFRLGSPGSPGGFPDGIPWEPIIYAHVAYLYLPIDLNHQV